MSLTPAITREPFYLMNAPSGTHLEVKILGQTRYLEARALQEEFAIEIASGTRSNTLLLLEHPHTITFGSSGEKKNLLWNEEQLKSFGVEVHWIDRGGDVTYHGPGQLIGYPLISLGKIDSSGHLPRQDYVSYLRGLEETIIKCLRQFGISAEQLPGLTGVWVESKLQNESHSFDEQPATRAAKIAAIGVKIDSRGISRHGFALNINPDPIFWESIIPCGLDDHAVISMIDLIQPVPTFEEVAKVTGNAFREVFGYPFDPNSS
jgi:lipoyl(octanoyl) transferase